MSTRTFTSPALGEITTGTFPATLLYARSNAVEAATRTLSLAGLDESSAAESEDLTITSSEGKLEVLGTNEFTTLSAAALSAACDGAVSIYAEGTAGQCPAYLTAQPSDGDTLTLGLTGFTQAYRFKNTTAAAYDVKIGGDVDTSASNLKAAINADGTGDGTDYHAGTTANPFLSAVVSGSILTLTDRIACNRQLLWAHARTGTALNVSNPSGGVDGSLVTSIAAASTNVYAAVNLDDESLALGGFPPLVDWTSDAMQVGGEPFSLHLASSDVTTPMVASYEFSTQSSPTVWRSGVSSITSLDNNSQIVTPAERVEWIRLLIENTNSTAASVNAKLVGPR